MRLHLFAVIPLVCLGSIAACSSSTPEPATPDPNNPCPPGQFCQQANATATAPAPTATTTAPAPSATASASSATPLPAGAAVAGPAFQAMGTAEAPGMKPDGAAFAGQFQEGQTLEQPINIQAGKCYTVIAASVGGITELDIQLVAQAAPLPPVVLAQDSTSGPNATLGGKKDGCWKNATPLAGPGKVILKATKGAGMAAGQVFVK
jgi:hypothetical protein